MRDNYKNGTFRFGHLENLSLVGTASEESGGFFPDVLDMLDEIPILSLVRLSGPGQAGHTGHTVFCYRLCPGGIRASCMRRSRGIRAMMVLFCGSGLESRAFLLESWASLLLKGQTGFLKLMLLEYSLNDYINKQAFCHLEVLYEYIWIRANI